MFDLVDLGPYAAVVENGTSAIAGEVYLVETKTLLAVDVARQVPLLFQRALVRLADGSDANAYVMTPDQVRGRRRIRPSDWRTRFTGHVRPHDGPFARWARGRSSR